MQPIDYKKCLCIVTHHLHNVWTVRTGRFGDCLKGQERNLEKNFNDYWFFTAIKPSICIVLSLWMIQDISLDSWGKRKVNELDLRESCSTNSSSIRKQGHGVCYQLSMMINNSSPAACQYITAFNVLKLT